MCGGLTLEVVDDGFVLLTRLGEPVLSWFGPAESEINSTLRSEQVPP
jgi:hypothetical protein